MLCRRSKYFIFALIARVYKIFNIPLITGVLSILNGETKSKSASTRIAEARKPQCKQHEPPQTPLTTSGRFCRRFQPERLQNANVSPVQRNQSRTTPTENRTEIRNPWQNQGSFPAKPSRSRRVWAHVKRKALQHVFFPLRSVPCSPNGVLIGAFVIIRIDYQDMSRSFSILATSAIRGNHRLHQPRA